MSATPRAFLAVIVPIAPIALVSALGFASGCHSAPSRPPIRDPETLETGARKPRGAQVSICFSGRSMGDDPYASGGNSALGALCVRLPNLVQDVVGPDGAYPFFRWSSDIDHALDVLVSSLDTDRDGGVTSADRDVDVNVVGFSWGGFNARDLIEKMASDRRFSPTRRRVARFFALDPYRTDALVFAKRVVDVPANVDELWEFRHTMAPEGDCSRLAGGLIGPFTGRAPRCTDKTVCHDFDYSLEPATKNVDHCEIPAYAAPHILRIVSGEVLTGLPQERRVVRY
jgi:hypothetical protein